MKKVIALIIVVILALSVIFIWNINKDTDNGDPSTKAEINNPIIGVWRHQDVPPLPHYKTWVITINKDGTYKTESESFQTDVGISSHTESFGEKGTYPGRK